MLWSKQERVEAVFSHEIPDQVPIFECLLNDGILEHFGGKHIKAGDAEGFTRACAKCLDVCHPLWLPEESRIEKDSDYLYRSKKTGSFFWNKWGFSPGFTKKYERWTNWIIERPFKTDDECVKWIKEQIEKEEAWQPDDNFVENYRQRVAIMKKWKGDMVYPDIYTMDGLYKNYLLVGMEKFVYIYYDHPELIRRWVKVTNERILRKLEVKLCYHDSPVAMIWSDLAAKGGLLFSPGMLEDICYPYLKEIIDLLHSKNFKVIFHSDGDMAKALPVLVDKLHIDGFNTVEVGAGMNVRQVKEEYGDRLVLVGGMDADILARGTKEQVVTETKKLIDTAGKNRGLLIASSIGELNNSMPTENILTYFETIWDYGRYPTGGENKR